MRVLLLQPPIEDVYITPIRTYPLNLIYLASALEAAGIDVAILDCLNPPTRKTLAYPKEFEYLKDIYHPNEIGPTKLFGHYYRFGLSDKEILTNIATFTPDIIGISANFTAYFNTIEHLCRIIKKAFPDIKIVIGGYHATVFAQDIKSQCPEIDHVITGEGEAALLQYLGGDASPFSFESFVPNHAFIKPELYQMHRQNMAAMTASRGCVKACSFCTVSSMYGRSMRWRTIEAIIAEMEQLYTQNHVRVFDFEDDNLSVNRKWFIALLTKIIETFTDIRLYAMNGIAFETLDRELLDLMWQAGFRNLNLALVTSQEPEQERLHRQTNNAIFDRVVNVAQEIGFEMTVYFILGLPGQTANDVNETLTFLYQYDVLVAPSVYYPPPGTDLYNNEPWIMCRSSAFALDTATFPRSEQVEIFRRVRLLNFMKSMQKHFNVENWNNDSIKRILAQTLSEEERVGTEQIREYLESGIFNRVYRMPG